MIMSRIPPSRIHPIVFSRAARQDDEFVKNLVSDRFRMSIVTVLLMAGSIAALLLLLVLLG
jgi:hypothetical protein